MKSFLMPTYFPDDRYSLPPGLIPWIGLTVTAEVEPEAPERVWLVEPEAYVKATDLQSDWKYYDSIERVVSLFGWLTSEGVFDSLSDTVSFWKQYRDHQRLWELHVLFTNIQAIRTDRAARMRLAVLQALSGFDTAHAILARDAQ